MEKFDDNFQNTKKLLEFYLEKYGVERTIDFLKNIASDLVWINYKEINGKDENDGLLQIYDLNEEEIKEDLTIDEVKIIWNVFSTNEDIQKIITDSMSKIEYDSNDIESRLDVMYILISAIELLYEVSSVYSDNFNLLYEETNKKLAELNIKDFYIVYSSIISRNFFNNPKFEKVIKDKINAMTPSEFVYFLRTAESDLDVKNNSLMEIIKDKTIQLDNNLVNKVYVNGNYIDFPKIDFKEGKLDNVARLINGIENPQEAIKTLNNLTDVEFVSYLYNYYDSNELLDKKILNSEEFNKRIKNLSRINLEFLLEKFGDSYYCMKDIKIDENVDELVADRMEKFKEYGMQWKTIYDEALERKIAVDNSDVQNSYNIIIQKEDIDELMQMEPIYSANKYIGYIPFFYPTNEEYNDIREKEEYENEYQESYEYDEDEYIDEYEEYNDEYQEEYEDKYEYEDDEYFDFDEDDEYEQEKFRQIEIEAVNNLYKNLDELLEFYDVLDNLYQTSDFKILQMANHYNVKYKNKDTLEMKEIQNYIIRYLKSRVINMPNKYASFFINIKDGCLNSSMQLKEEELQNKILNKSQDNDAKGL